MNGWELLIFFYLCGSIPSGLILAKTFGYGDIRAIGSGNIGATNVLRTGNKKLAALTLLCDFLKSFLPCKWIIWHVIAHSHALAEPQMLALYISAFAGLFAIVGHIFPLWLKFKGGKGVATALGVLFALHYLLGLGFIICWLTVFSLFRISSLSALTAFVLVTLGSAGLVFSDITPINQIQYNVYFQASVVITLIIFLTHRQNIARLLKGEEHKWSKK